MLINVTAKTGNNFISV